MVWKALHEAPMLTHLELDFDRDIYRAFDRQSLPPQSVTTLKIDLANKRHIQYGSFGRMLGRRAPNLAAILFQPVQWLVALKKAFDISKRVSMASKIVDIQVTPANFEAVPKTIITLDVARNFEDFIPWQNLAHLDSLTTLKTVVHTEELLQFFGLFPKLKI